MTKQNDVSEDWTFEINHKGAKIILCVSDARKFLVSLDGYGSDCSDQCKDMREVLREGLADLDFG